MFFAGWTGQLVQSGSEPRDVGIANPGGQLLDVQSVACATGCPINLGHSGFRMGAAGFRRPNRHCFRLVCCCHIRNRRFLRIFSLGARRWGRKNGRRRTRQNSISRHRLARIAHAFARGSAALEHIKANKDRPDQFEDQLQAAIRSCENATSLVNDLLDHQQLVHDDLTLNTKAQLIQPFIGHVARELSALAELKRLKLRHSVSRALADEVRVFDERKLRQIIQNLAANAIKYTRSGGVHIDLAEGEKSN